MIENELKMMLSQEQFKQTIDTLSFKYGIATSDIQVNYYYDSEDYFIAFCGDSLRVRQKNNRLSIEYKCKKSTSNNIRKCEEHKKSIDSLPDILVLSKEFPIDDDHVYHYIGNLITERMNFHINNTIVSLDKNYYLGKVDYEIEIESEDIERINEVKDLLQLHYQTNEIGKYKRFLNAYYAFYKKL